MNTEQSSDLARRAAVHAALADQARLLITDTLAEGDASPSELGALLAMPSNLLAHHLHVLEQAGIITRRRSEGDRRRSYLRLVPGALDGLGRVAAAGGPPGAVRLHRELRPVAPRRRAVAAGQPCPRGVGRHASGRRDRPRRGRRGTAAPAPAAPAAAPAHQRRPRGRRPGHHGLRPRPRGTRRARGAALVGPGPGPVRRRGQLRRGPGRAEPAGRAVRPAPGRGPRARAASPDERAPGPCRRARRPWRRPRRGWRTWPGSCRLRRRCPRRRWARSRRRRSAAR